MLEWRERFCDELIYAFNGFLIFEFVEIKFVFDFVIGIFSIYTCRGLLWFGSGFRVVLGLFFFSESLGKVRGSW